MKEFALCGVCRLSHDQGRPHIYTKRHTTALATLLDKELRRMGTLATWLESHSRSLASAQEQSAPIAAGIAAHGGADERQNGAHSHEERRDWRSLTGTRDDDGIDRAATNGASDGGAWVPCAESRKRSRWCRFCDADVAEDSEIGGWKQWVRHVSSADHMTSVRAFWAANCSGRGVVAADTARVAAALTARLAAATAPSASACAAHAVNSNDAAVPARDGAGGASAKRRAKKQRGSNHGGLEIKEIKEIWRAFVLPPATAAAAGAAAAAAAAVAAAAVAAATTGAAALDDAEAALASPPSLPVPPLPAVTPSHQPPCLPLTPLPHTGTPYPPTPTNTATKPVVRQPNPTAPLLNLLTPPEGLSLVPDSFCPILCPPITNTKIWKFRAQRVGAAWAEKRRAEIKAAEAARYAAAAASASLQFVPAGPPTRGGSADVLGRSSTGSPEAASAPTATAAGVDAPPAVSVGGQHSEIDQWGGSMWLPSFGRVWQSGPRQASRREFEAERRAQRGTHGQERQYKGGEVKRQKQGQETYLREREQHRHKGARRGGEEEGEAKEGKHLAEQPATTGIAVARLLPRADHSLPSQPSESHHGPYSGPVASQGEVVVAGSSDPAAGLQAFELRPYVPKRLRRYK
ncbi:unnamed protein product [Closterium sp. Yama58-4]|nr:unnamed protein product [Closterium sp. Yama58-4]